MKHLFRCLFALLCAALLTAGVILLRRLGI